MLINELSSKSGFSKDTIRFYEDQGIITDLLSRRLDNNYRDYSEAALNRLNIIKDLKDFGFTLKEITEILSLYEADPLSCPENATRIQNKLQIISDKINRLEEIKNKLSRLVDDCNEKSCHDNCSLNKTLSSMTCCN